MSEMEKLAEKLKQRKEESGENKVNSEALIKEWVDSLNNLFAGIETWLKPLIDAGVIGIERKSVHISENPHPELRARYEAPVLALTLSGKPVKIEPKGRYYFGCQGRVDLDLGKKTWIITRHVDGQERWVIQLARDPRPAVAFNSDSLAKALEDYL